MPPRIVLTSRAEGRTWVLDVLAAAVASAALSLVVFAPVLSGLGDSWGPGDMLSHYVNVDTWAGFGHRVDTHYGFPLGINQNLFPGVDITQNTVAATLSAITGNPFVGLNLVIIASFPLTAALTVIALRMVGLTGWWAIALAVSFTFVPYHWGRSLGHAYLGTMYAAVTGVILALLIGTGRLDRVRSNTWQLLGLTVLVVVTAWSNIYYAAFGLLLTLAAASFRLLKGDSPGQLGFALLPSFGIATVSVIGLIPAIIARVGESDIGQLGARAAYDSVTLAGNLAMALIPAPLSQLPYSGYYNEAVYALIDDAPALENVSATNFGSWVISASVIYAVIWWAVRLRQGKRIPQTFQLVTYLTLITTLFFIPWGLNSIVAEYLTAQIRAWNRLVPTLLLLLLLAGAIAIRHTPMLMRARWLALGPALVLVIVLVEQVWPWRAVYASTIERYSQQTSWARDYAAVMNQALPERCGIFQIPRMIYPENGPVPPDLTDYEHFWHPLVNGEKDFSYGAVAFTQADQVLADIQGFPDPQALAQLTDLDFCGVHVDLRGIAQDRRERLLANIEVTLGAPVATGRQGDWLLFALPGESAGVP